MKSLILASAIVAVTAISAHAEGGLMSSIKPDASIEYAVKSKAWAGDVGVTATVAGLTIRPAMDWAYSSGNSIAISGSSVKATMPLAGGMTAYSELSLTSKFKYSDVTIGMAFSF